MPVFVFILAIFLQACAAGTAPFSTSATESETTRNPLPYDSPMFKTEESSVTDAAVTLATEAHRVVALGSSLAEMWTLAGGTLVGTTEDSLDEFPELQEASVASVGSVKTPALESILALEPDLVILSADLAAHTAMKSILEEAKIRSYYAHVKTFEDYLQAMAELCALTGRQDLYQENALDVQKLITTEKATFKLSNPAPTYLLLRMHSSGGKVVAREQIAADILTELGAVNIAADDSDLLDDLSMEAILEKDPDYIFVVSMGDETAAIKTLAEMFEAQPAWQNLRAVRENRIIQLPKALFHNKPNARWGEAYAYIIRILSQP